MTKPHTVSRNDRLPDTQGLVAVYTVLAVVMATLWFASLWHLAQYRKLPSTARSSRRAVTRLPLIVSGRYTTYLCEFRVATDVFLIQLVILRVAFVRHFPVEGPRCIMHMYEVLYRGVVLQPQSIPLFFRCPSNLHHLWTAATQRIDIPSGSTCP